MGEIRDTWRLVANAAPDSHAGGRWFNPSCAHERKCSRDMACTFSRLATACEIHATVASALSHGRRWEWPAWCTPGAPHDRAYFRRVQQRPLMLRAREFDSLTT